jgi:hypothetical protein
MTNGNVIQNICDWFGGRAVGVTFVVLLVFVPLYVWENYRRKGNCKIQMWFTFSLNIAGIMAGLYVFVPTLIKTLVYKEANNAQTMMTGLGSFAVIVFTGINIWSELKTLFEKPVQPKKRSEENA